MRSVPLSPSFALLCALAMPVSAGVNHWTEGGPPRAACSPGFIRCSVVQAMALDPFDENVMYATMSSGPFDATDRDGLWRSSDGGETWTRLTLQLRSVSGSPVSVRLSPTDPRTLYVLSEYALYRSPDGGNTWVETKLPADYVRNTDLIIDPRNTGTLYVAQENACGFGVCVAGGVFRSDDSGRRWRSIGLENRFISRLTADPANASTLYAISRGRVFQSRNGGGSWKEVTPASPPAVSMIAVDPLIPSTIHAVGGTFSDPFRGIFKSTDRAQSWRLILDDALANGGPNVIAVDPVHSMQLLATTGYGGVVRSTDGAESWTVLNDGLEKVGKPLQLVIAPSGATFHAVIEDGFVFHYTLLPPRRRAAGK